MICGCRKTSGKLHSFAIQLKETQRFWLIFILYFLLFCEPETQSDPWRNSGTEGANWHGSDLKKIFTQTSVKENCELSHTSSLQSTFCQCTESTNFFFFGDHIGYLCIIFEHSCYPLQKFRPTQRVLDVVLRTLFNVNQNHYICSLYI